MGRYGHSLLMGLVLAAIFFVAGVATIHDYGISWDEPAHFTRGQSYLDYFLTGESTLASVTSGRRVSIYEVPSTAADFYFEKDSGHPPLNGIAASVFNRLFYQKLHWIGDVESYHLFNVFISAFLVFVVVAFASEAYGWFAGVVAGIGLMTYPLFWGESHFNVKDPAETAFIAATIWAVWKSTKSGSWKWVTAAAVFFGLGLSVKFNILFLPFIVVPWLILRFGGVILKLSKKTELRVSMKLVVSVLMSPLLILAIFFGGWPYLWRDTREHLANILKYYKDIGTGGRGQLGYLLPGGFNLFPIVWVTITTPPVLLVLFALGLIAFLKNFLREKDKTVWLWLIWVLVPIVRVSMPDTSIYGGDRQIMEFVPALCLLSGFGASQAVIWGKELLGVKWKKWLMGLLVMAFIPNIIILGRLHPNENVYFNFLIGGLSGARATNIPYWGNSFGNAYLQAVNWLNNNAKEGSGLALIQGTATNIPVTQVDAKIKYGNNLWSGMDRKGEYLLELTHEGSEIAYPYVWYYIKTALQPVYEVKADGVAIAKIWKNDSDHSREGYREEVVVPVKVEENGGVLQLKLGGEMPLSLLTMELKTYGNCVSVTGLVQRSASDGDWTTFDEKIGDYQVSFYSSLEESKVRYGLYGYKGDGLRVVWNGGEGCLIKAENVKLSVFK